MLQQITLRSRGYLEFCCAKTILNLHAVLALVFFRVTNDAVGPLQSDPPGTINLPNAHRAGRVRMCCTHNTALDSPDCSVSASGKAPVVS